MFSEHLLFIVVSSGCVVSGAGAFEVAVADALVKHKPNVKGRAQLGVQAYADALLVIPKVRGLSSVFIIRQEKQSNWYAGIHTVSASVFNCASSFVGFGPELWL